jgi:hypothetical protein
MYNQRAKFEFLEETPQSERLRFLTELARCLEAEGKKSEISPGFSIELKPNGHAKVDVWQPGKWDALAHQLDAAAQRKLLRRT